MKKIREDETKMKKLLMILVVLVLCIALVACGNKEDKQKEKFVLDVENAEALVNDLVEIVGAENMFMGMFQPLTSAEAPTDLGLAEEDFEAKIVDAAKYDPPMIPAFHSLCIVKVKDGEDVAAVKQTIFDNANYRKWVCSAAEKVLVADCGDYVMLVMSTPEVCNNLYAALQTKAGAENVGEALVRDGEPAPNFDEVMEDVVEDVVEENMDEIVDEVIEELPVNETTEEVM